MDCEDESTKTVDGLRACAVLMVFCYHSWLLSWINPTLGFFDHILPISALIKNGYLGVEVFFVISGFCLFLPYARGYKQQQKKFFMRRFLKIVPSYYLALAATTVLAHDQFSRAQLYELIVKHLLFLQSYGLQFGAVNSVFWSIAIEMQYYLIFPIIAYLFVRNPAIMVTLMTCTALLYRICTHTCCNGDEAITRELPAFLDVFAIGMYAASVLERGRQYSTQSTTSKRLWTIASAAFFIIIFVIIHFADMAQANEGGREQWITYWRGIFGFAVAGLLIASCFALPFIRRALTNVLFGYLSVISYNIYLWHTLIELALMRYHLVPVQAADPQKSPAWQWWFYGESVVITIVCASAITYFIERPLLALAKPRKFAFPWDLQFKALIKRYLTQRAHPENS